MSQNKIPSKLLSNFPGYDFQQHVYLKWIFECKIIVPIQYGTPVQGRGTVRPPPRAAQASKPTSCQRSRRGDDFGFPWFDMLQHPTSASYILRLPASYFSNNARLTSACLFAACVSVLFFSLFGLLDKPSSILFGRQSRPI